jgi:hypothetical protein
MTTRRVELGTLPRGYDATYVAEGAADPLAVMLREGHAALDRIRAEEERALAAKAADIARMANTKRARARRYLGKALKMFVRMR